MGPFNGTLCLKNMIKKYTRTFISSTGTYKRKRTHKNWQAHGDANWKVNRKANRQTQVNTARINPRCGSCAQFGKLQSIENSLRFAVRSFYNSTCQTQIENCAANHFYSYTHKNKIIQAKHHNKKEFGCMCSERRNCICNYRCSYVGRVEKQFHLQLLVQLQMNLHCSYK